MNAKIAVVLSLIACVINCVGLAIPYWLVASKDEAGLSISVNSGIWLVCYHGVIYGLQVDKCNSYDDPKILTVRKYILFS
ncbi:hypothetical protein DPMN_187490 [Dreissena polymorpha]|uniref:Uncharacterized protein n=1 Tax=Dreissena polymorpha TaxID=45954 RepID=A0A9D4DP56_DREPO|nr:hypothetical protein DPMN_187490 [Dreissena polymorpha]